MPYIEMIIDSVRHAMHRDEWLVLLKEKSGQRCLPVYVDKVWADAVGEMLMGGGEDTGEVIDDELKQVVMGGEAKLVIDVDGDSFKAKFVGQGDDVKCPVGKGLAVAARVRIEIMVEEKVL